MSRHRILRRVREALEGRDGVEHPGAFDGRRTTEGRGARGDGTGEPSPEAAFTRAFQEAGGEVALAADRGETVGLLEELTAGLPGMAAGAGVDPALLPHLPRLEAADAPVGISLARGAVAETGSLLLDARDGRRAQLLPPLHLVLVPREYVHPTLAAALAAVAGDLPSALALHSGPSKSADIGQVLVTGVHGPGRVVAVLAPADAL